MGRADYHFLNLIYYTDTVSIFGNAYQKNAIAWKNSLRKSNISVTAAFIFHEAQINTRRLDYKFDRQLALGQRASLGPADYFVKKIRQRTKIPVRMIFRDHGFIRLSIEVNEPRIDYDETLKEKCTFSILHVFPAAVLKTAPGKVIGDLIGGLGVLGKLEITDASMDGDWSLFTVRQSWQRIE